MSGSRYDHAYLFGVDVMWTLEKSWGVRCGGVPLEEITWAMLTMFIGGPLARASSALRSEPRHATSVA